MFVFQNGHGSSFLCAFSHQPVLKNAFALASLADFIRAVVDLGYQWDKARSLFSPRLPLVNGAAPRLGCSDRVLLHNCHLVLECLCKLLKYLSVFLWVTLVQLDLFHAFLADKNVHFLFVDLFYNWLVFLPIILLIHCLHSGTNSRLCAFWSLCSSFIGENQVAESEVDAQG